jgi:hypothetical protein
MVASRGAVVLLSILVCTAACGDDSADAPAAADETLAAARRHCAESGGEALIARPEYGTNSDPEAWLELAGEAELCRFENVDDDTRIYVDLVTLYSEEPTLAGVAYLSRVGPMLPDQPSANPATFNCDALGGSAQWGTGVAGGGWVTSDRPTEVVDLCVFPDRSFIDEFGIFYYAGDVVRGTDLATVMRYAADPLPAIFTEVERPNA